MDLSDSNQGRLSRNPESRSVLYKCGPVCQGNAIMSHQEQSQMIMII